MGEVDISTYSQFKKIEKSVFKVPLEPKRRKSKIQIKQKSERSIKKPTYRNRILFEAFPCFSVDTAIYRQHRES